MARFSEQINSPDFYLTSTESDFFPIPRRCRVLRRITYADNSDCMLIAIEPLLIGQRFGLGAADIGLLLISAKTEFSCLFPIQKWPVHVDVFRLTTEYLGQESLAHGEAELIDWGELYDTLEAATTALEQSDTD